MISEAIKSKFYKKKQLKKITEIAFTLGVKTYLVGGPLRDALLGVKRIKDLDIACDKRVKEIVKLFAKETKGKYIFYNGFNTGTVFWDFGHRIDFAETRKEVYLKPGSLPKVAAADINQDLLRRDFTINAMGWDLSSNRLIDPCNGLADLEQGLIRVLHRKSFIDDPTRIFRAIRFASRFNFQIEENTLKLLRAAIKEGYLSRLSGKRILSELRLILKEKDPIKPLRWLNKEGVFYRLWKKRLSENFFSQLSLVFKNPLKRDSGGFLFLLAQLLSLDSYRRDKRMPLTKSELKTIRDLKRFPKKELKIARKPSEIYRLLRNLSLEAIQIYSRLLELKERRKIQDYLSKFRNVRIFATGDDLKRFGFKPGPLYTKLLDALRFAHLDGKVRTKQEEIKFLNTKRTYER